MTETNLNDAIADAGLKATNAASKFAEACAQIVICGGRGDYQGCADAIQTVLNQIEAFERAFSELRDTLKAANDAVQSPVKS